MRLKKLVLVLAALMMVASIAACGSSGQSGGNDEASPKKSEEAQKDVAAKKDEKQTDGGEKKKRRIDAPEDKTLGLTIPKLDKDFDNIPTGLGNNTQLLKDNAAVHIRYPTTSGEMATGWPWQKVANVYLAGHVEGYEGTPSYKAFDGLKTLENGDEIIVSDADGKEYTYEVYETKIVPPTEVEVLNPVPGKNIVTLQTCEIVNVDADGNPDYSNTERFIVRAEIKDSGA